MFQLHVETMKKKKWVAWNDGSFGLLFSVYFIKWMDFYLAGQDGLGVWVDFLCFIWVLFDQIIKNFM